MPKSRFTQLGHQLQSIPRIFAAESTLNLKIQQMKQFFVRRHKNVFVQAMQSGSVISLFVYISLRCLFHEFPMSLSEEIFFFLKTGVASCLLIATAMTGSAWLYAAILKWKPRRKVM